MESPKRLKTPPIALRFPEDSDPVPAYPPALTRDLGIRRLAALAYSRGHSGKDRETGKERAGRK